ncbi:MAG: exopolysaccharide biosynthesis polyprenyl glycosylphosphotransferase [Candidatus Berkelbacteria bacterium]
MKKAELTFAFLLVPVDIAVIIFSFAVSYFLRQHLGTDLGSLAVDQSVYLKIALYIIPIWVVVFAMNGLYNIRSSSSFLSEMGRIIVASSVAMLFLVLGIFLTKTLFFSRVVLAFTWVDSIVFLILGRMIMRLIQSIFLRFGVGRRNIVVIGKNEISNRLESDTTNDGLVFRLVKTFSGDEDYLSVENQGLPYLLKKNQLDEVVVTDANLNSSKLMKIIRFCYANKVSFKYAPDIISFMHFVPSNIGATPLLELQPTALDGWGRIIKRIFDIVLSTILLIILSPLFLLVAVLQILTSKGPIFYKHERIGRDEKSFNFYKFRSMYIDKCDFAGGKKWTTAADDQCKVTPLGRVLRKTNIDELPQLLNILIGDMSFVGPRPEFPKLVDKFEKEIPDYYLRHHIKVGLTGWAQVNGLKGDTSVEERVKYDLYYIENWSFGFDMKIIVKTIFLVIDEAIFGKIEYRSRPRVDR